MAENRYERSSQAITVYFQPAFFIESIGRMYPAGEYSIETQDEPIEGLSFEHHRHLAMTMTPREQITGASLQTIRVDRRELAAAIVTSQFRHDRLNASLVPA